MQRSRVGPSWRWCSCSLPLSACGTDGTPRRTTEAPQQVSEADQACRDRWHDLSATVATQADRGGMVKRVFASRWESLAAGVAYHESTATADQCDEEIDGTEGGDQVPARAGRQGAALRHGEPAREGAGEPRRVRGRPPAGEGTGAGAPGLPHARRAYGAADKAIAPAVVQLADTDPTESRTITRRMRDLELLAGPATSGRCARRPCATIHAYEHLTQDRQEARLTCRRPVVC